MVSRPYSCCALSSRHSTREKPSLRTHLHFLYDCTCNELTLEVLTLYAKSILIQLRRTCSSHENDHERALWLHRRWGARHQPRINRVCLWPRREEMRFGHLAASCCCAAVCMRIIIIIIITAHRANYYARSRNAICTFIECEYVFTVNMSAARSDSVRQICDMCLSRGLIISKYAYTNDVHVLFRCWNKIQPMFKCILLTKHDF